MFRLFRLDCRRFALLVALGIASSIGCQGMRQHQTPSASTRPSGSRDVMLTVSSESSRKSSRQPLVTLSREVEAPASETEETSSPLWSRITSPSRFLLPRTDLDENSASKLESTQSLAAGF